MRIILIDLPKLLTPRTKIIYILITMYFNKREG